MIGNLIASHHVYTCPVPPLTAYRPPLTAYRPPLMRHSPSRVTFARHGYVVDFSRLLRTRSIIATLLCHSLHLATSATILLRRASAQVVHDPGNQRILFA